MKVKELQDEMQEIFRKQKMGKKLKGNEKNIRELWDEIKRNNIRMLGVLETQEGKLDEELLVQEILAKDFPELSAGRDTRG